MKQLILITALCLLASGCVGLLSPDADERRNTWYHLGATLNAMGTPAGCIPVSEQTRLTEQGKYVPPCMNQEQHVTIERR